MKRAKKRAAVVESSSGNVFEDLGLPDADERLAKAQLARIVRNTIRQRKWTQQEAATVLGIAPSDMSDLMRGKLARFSQERIARFLNALDLHVRIQVGPRPAGIKHAGVTVEMVVRF